jgi:DNA (cytosine-5)-methyltransferase 1
LVPSCDHKKYHPQYPTAWNRTKPLRFVAVSGGWQKLPFNIIQEAMGIDWMNEKELSEAIPPAYTNWIANQLIGRTKVIN